jgi:hypothetical protein
MEGPLSDVRIQWCFFCLGTMKCKAAGGRRALALDAESSVDRTELIKLLTNTKQED